MHQSFLVLGLGLVIESTEIYNTMKLIFELIWDNLPEVRMPNTKG